MTGWTSEARKDLTIRPSKNTWTTIATFTGLPDGPTILAAELYGTLAGTFPKNIRTRLLRPGNDPTKRTGLVVGTGADWSATGSWLEFIGPDDQPLELQVWHDGSTGALTITAVITKSFAPAAFIAGRLV